MTDILLLNMPFVSISRPAIGISTLKSVLTAQNIQADIAYPNILFAQMMGLPTYELLDEKLSDALFCGDWLFAQYLFAEELDLDTYINTLEHYTEGKSAFEKIMAARDRIEEFLLTCIETYNIKDYSIIGFTSTFEQNLASLALAKLIKTKYPDKKTIIGGSNCEGLMGLQIHKSFPWIDYVCTGEGEKCLLELVTRLKQGLGVQGVRGIIYRDGDQSIDNGLVESAICMNDIPIPDYDDYFLAIRDNGMDRRLNPSLPIETSRGCWWGAKSHCTFCGLNGATMNFRSKSTSRVIHELQYLKTRYSIQQFVAVDNIIDMSYFQDLLPQLRDRPLGVSLFYETKANLKKEQVLLLKGAGIHAIQPGIESLSSHVLKLMRKGVTAIQNIQLLKWCKEYGINVAWNLLYGFPGETQRDFEDIYELMDSIYHLQPPHSIGTVRMDRFSPYFTDPESFGLKNVKPFTIYQYIYPVPAEDLKHLVYFFEYESREQQQIESYITRLRDKVDAWKASSGCNLSKKYDDDSGLLITDTRPNRVHEHIVLKGIQKDVYDFCEQKRSHSGITRFLDQTYGLCTDIETWLSQFLKQMVEWRLMVFENGHFLSLATIEQDHTRQKSCL